MGLDELLKKAEENFKTAEWAEKKNYLDAAVSRYYYCVYEKVIYISAKRGFYEKPISVKNKHATVVNKLIEKLDNKLTPDEKITLQNMKRLTSKRISSDYDKRKIDNLSFGLEFKYYFNEVNDTLNKFL